MARSRGKKETPLTWQKKEGSVREGRGRGLKGNEGVSPNILNMARGRRARKGLWWLKIKSIGGGGEEAANSLGVVRMTAPKRKGHLGSDKTITLRGIQNC